jgi:hypothetical protein
VQFDSEGNIIAEAAAEVYSSSLGLRTQEGTQRISTNCVKVKEGNIPYFMKLGDFKN